MSKTDFSVLENYSKADIKRFNDENEPVTAEQKVFFAWLYYQDIGYLEGKILTIIDACIGEPKQNKAVKDLIRRSIWFDWVKNLDQTDKECSNGMPDLI